MIKKKLRAFPGKAKGKRKEKAREYSVGVLFLKERKVPTGPPAFGKRRWESPKEEGARGVKSLKENSS